MQRLEIRDGTLQHFLDSWRQECLRYDEDFLDYAPFVLSSMETQCKLHTGESHTGIFALGDGEGGYDAVCYITGVFIPGYKDRVLRVREILLRPKYDFEETKPYIYAAVLKNLISQCVRMSEGDIPCKHLKFHFRSPYDTQLVGLLTKKLNEILKKYGQNQWQASLIGAWLYIDKEDRTKSRIEKVGVQ